MSWRTRVIAFSVMPLQSVMMVLSFRSAAGADMLRFHVGGKVVENVDLLRKKHWTWRLDVWPFAILYAVWVTAVVPSLDFADAAIVLGGLVGLHILVWLFTAWSVDFKCFVQYGRVSG